MSPQNAISGDGDHGYYEQYIGKEITIQVIVPDLYVDHSSFVFSVLIRTFVVLVLYAFMMVRWTLNELKNDSYLIGWVRC